MTSNKPFRGRGSSSQKPTRPVHRLDRTLLDSSPDMTFEAREPVFRGLMCGHTVAPRWYAPVACSSCLLKEQDFLVSVIGVQCSRTVASLG